MQGMSGFVWLLSLPKLLSLTLHNVRGRVQLRQFVLLSMRLCYPDRCGRLLTVRVSAEAVTTRGRVSVQQVLGTPERAHPVPGDSGHLPPRPPVPRHLRHQPGRTQTRQSRCLSHPRPDLQVRTTDSLSDIEILDREDNPLEFLGLYKTHTEASSRHHIPARVISGDTEERQVLVAGGRYLHRPAVMQSVLNDLVRVIRYENCRDVRGALDILLLAMETHPHEKHIQISGSAGLYYIVQTEQLKREWNIKVSSSP